MLIGFTGRPGAGQDIAADYLATSDHRFAVVSFDRPLRSMLRAGFALGDEHFREPLFHSPLPQIKKSPEQLLHSLRWTWIRSATCPDTLLDPAREAFAQARASRIDVAIPDVCTEAEAALVREFGGILIHLVNAHAPNLGPDPRLKLADFDRELHVTERVFSLYNSLDELVGEELFCGELS